MTPVLFISVHILLWKMLSKIYYRIAECAFCEKMVLDIDLNVATGCKGLNSNTTHSSSVVVLDISALDFSSNEITITDETTIYC
jgi:hypothetical protein